MMPNIFTEETCNSPESDYNKRNRREFGDIEFTTGQIELGQKCISEYINTDCNDLEKSVQACDKFYKSIK